MKDVWGLRNWFRTCGVLEFVIAVATSVGLSRLRDQSLACVLWIALFGAMSFVALAFATKVATGFERLVFTARQGKRAAGIGSRTYAQERAEVIKDLDTAGVPKSKQAEILGATDAYFKKVRDNIRDPATRDAIFGDWRK